MCSIHSSFLHMVVPPDSEFFSAPDSYFTFLNEISRQLSSSPSPVSDHSEFSTALMVAAPMVGPAALATLRASLVLRSYSPAVASLASMRINRILRGVESIPYDRPDAQEIKDAKQALWTECQQLIAVGGELYCGVESVDWSVLDRLAADGDDGDDISSVNEPTFDFDRVHPASSGTTNVILYANPLTPTFVATHAALVGVAASKGVRYILRSFTPISSSPLFVQGWGVELAIKNMEYKVLDDSKIAYDADTVSNVDLPDDMMGGGDDENEVSGFLFDTLIARRPDLAKELAEFRSSLLRDAASVDASGQKVAVWDMKDLGYQAAQRILKSSHPLEVMRDLTQNFPMYAQALTRTKVNSTIKDAIERNAPKQNNNNQRIAGMLPPAGSAYIDLNGQTIDLASSTTNGENELDIHSIMDLFKNEALTLDALRELKLTPDSVPRLLDLDLSSKADSAKGGAQFLLNMDVDSPDVKPILFWFNDLDSDSRYRSWPPSVNELLQPGWPNQLKYVRRNLYTGILIIDPSSSKGLEFLTQAYWFIQQNAPIRFGLVFYIPPPIDAENRPQWNIDVASKDKYATLLGDADADEEAAASGSPSSSIQATIAKLFYFLVESASATSKKPILDGAMDFLQVLHDSNPNRRGVSVTRMEVGQAFQATCKKFKIKAPKVKAILNRADLDERIEQTRAYLDSRGFVPDADQSLLPGQMPVMVVNGVVHRAAVERSLRDVMMTAIFAEQQKMTMKVYMGEIHDRTPDIHRALQTKPNVYPRLNPTVTCSINEMTFIAPTDLPRIDDAHQPAYLTSTDPDDSATIAHLTFWHVGDWSSARALAEVESILTLIDKPRGDQRVRGAFIHLPSPTKNGDVVSKVASALLHAGASQITSTRRFEAIKELVLIARYFLARPAQLTQAIDIFLTGDLAFLKPAVTQSIGELNGGLGLNPAFSDSLIASILSKAKSRAALVLNGRIIPIDTFAASTLLADMRLAASFTHINFGLDALTRLIATRGTNAQLKFTLTSDRYGEVEWLNEVAFRASLILVHRALSVGASTPSIAFPSYDDSNRLSMIEFRNSSAPFKLRVVLDPLSKLAQKLSPILITLRDLFEPDMRIWLNPKSGITEFPIKRFYRYALASTLTFENGSLKPFSGMYFRGLTTHHILSTVVFTPESWLVSLEKAKPDLDNLRVEELGDGIVQVQYQLQHLLIFGQCLESAKNDPPAGLQLMLTSKASGDFISDTLVMANLGYFQLKAAPGEWTLNLANSKHSDIFDIVAVGSTKSRAAGGLKAPSMFVRGWSEGFVKLNVKRKPGQEQTQLLDLTAPKKGKQAGGIWSSVFGGGDSVDSAGGAVVSSKSNRTGDTIHVFSLASGHLYERFLKIMMLSVLNSTRNPVKFWFLSNFASPQFLEFVPQMADQLGFEVEFVTYKWPLWLRRQDEKQRIIWGYKILFLDVLFPLAVRRIIYIDSDQVVRGDIRELHEMDLQGAPYAYTPFCDSNKETEGFRFWKQGYWKDHLRGKPYHISALYVVDLERFRIMRAGDSLRQIYDQLSADPNSLANLDQDLPNYAQNLVPIYSLPASWLWCQTWCSMDSLKDAKTIDLCNNPLTKTPKLEVAKQLLPEWTGLDAQAKAIEQAMTNGVAPTQTEQTNQSPKETTIATDTETRTPSSSHEDL